jgi:hypothetical protein
MPVNGNESQLNVDSQRVLLSIQTLGASRPVPFVRCAALRPPLLGGTYGGSIGAKEPPPSGVRARYIIMPLGLGPFVWALLTLLGAVKCPIFKSISIRIDLLVSENWHAYLFMLRSVICVSPFLL